MTNKKNKDTRRGKHEIVLVGSQNGKRKVFWLNLVALSLSLSMIIGCGMGTVYYFLAGKWSHFPVLWGIVIGAAMVGTGLISGLKTPISKLRNVN